MKKQERSLKRSFNDYCDTDYSFVSGEKKQKMTEKEEVRSMAQWPEKGCVAVVDDILVIKLSAEGEK